MSITASFSERLTVNGLTYSGATSVTSGGSTITIEEVIPAASTNLAVTLAFPFAKLKAYYIQADAACTLEFNNSTTGVPTIALEEGRPVMWAGHTHASLFTADVTSLFVTCTAGCTLKMLFVVDPT